MYVVDTVVAKMPTLRGVSVGDSLTMIIVKYGLPTKTRENSKENTCWYIYGTQGAEISFLVDNKTGKVIKLVAALSVA